MQNKNTLLIGCKQITFKKQSYLPNKNILINILEKWKENVWGKSLAHAKVKQDKYLNHNRCMCMNVKVL